MTAARTDRVVDHDVVIVGAGFGGLRFLHEAHCAGLTVRAFEAGTDVGGTWYWNRYPGARTDTEAWGYCFPFDEALLQEWDWSERYPSQAEVLEYLRHIADRYDLRRDIRFGTRVVSAHYDEDRNRWTVTLDTGDTTTCRYFVAASGVLSATRKPPFPGVEVFDGEVYETSRWPHQPVDFAGKRVAVIGAGASAVQALPVIAHAAGHVTMFQRTANYVMPSRNRVLEDAERGDIKRRYDTYWQQMYNQFFCFPFEDTDRSSADCPTPEALRRVLDKGWEDGGFRYVFQTFADILTSQECNDLCAEYVREKIRAIVEDPATAELLCPQGYPIGGNRPPLGHFYYEAFNRDNVSLVSVLGNPITEITPKGIRLQDGTEHEFDMLVFAIGFDAVTGSFTSMDIRGRNGQGLADAWAADGPETVLGVVCPEFPNFFMMFGPQSPPANLPPILDMQAKWIAGLIQEAHARGHDRIEAGADAAAAYTADCRGAFEALLLNEGSLAGIAWWSGANIPGKAIAPLFHFSGVPAYLSGLAAETEDGYRRFELSGTAAYAHS